MKAYERLLKYVTFRTPSDENSETTPSSACQFELARFVKNEMEGLNLSDIVLDDMCYLYGKLPATKGYENAPAIGFIAHMLSLIHISEPTRRTPISYAVFCLKKKKNEKKKKNKSMFLR